MQQNKTSLLLTSALTLAVSAGALQAENYAAPVAHDEVNAQSQVSEPPITLPLRRECFRVSPKTGAKTAIDCMEIDGLSYSSESVSALLNQNADGQEGLIGTATAPVPMHGMANMGASMATMGNRYKVTRSRTIVYGSEAVEVKAQTEAEATETSTVDAVQPQAAAQQVAAPPAITAPIVVPPAIVEPSIDVATEVVTPEIVAPIIVSPEPLFWSYIGAGIGLKKIGFEDKGGFQSAFASVAQLIAGVQYKKTLGIEGRVGIGLTEASAKFDCGYKSLCDLKLKDDLSASLFARAQFPIHSATPYVLAGANYSKITGVLSDAHGKAEDERSGFGFALGGGVEIAASKNLKMSLEYIHYSNKTASFGITSRYVF